MTTDQRVRPQRTRRTVLTEAEGVREQIRLIDQRIAGLGFMPKTFREQRHEEFKAEREKLVAQFRLLKDEFDSIQ
jgi:small-conductance mechanosensitive channel